MTFTENKQPTGQLQNADNEGPLTSPATIQVSPHRLEFGIWCHQRNKMLGEGDISAAYSGDLIALEGRVRKPFLLQGWRRVTTTMTNCGASSYRLVPIACFEGKPTTYRDKLFTNNGDDARGDPLGFYHGMQVQYGGQQYVLAGPSVEIVAGQKEPEQAELF